MRYWVPKIRAVRNRVDVNLYGCMSFFDTELVPGEDCAYTIADLAVLGQNAAAWKGEQGSG